MFCPDSSAAMCQQIQGDWFLMLKLAAAASHLPGSSLDVLIHVTVFKTVSVFPLRDFFIPLGL